MNADSFISIRNLKLPDSKNAVRMTCIICITIVILSGLTVCHSPLFNGMPESNACHWLRERADDRSDSTCVSRTQTVVERQQCKQLLSFTVISFDQTWHKLSSAAVQSSLPLVINNTMAERVHPSGSRPSSATTRLTPPAANTTLVTPVISSSSHRPSEEEAIQALLNITQNRNLQSVQDLINSPTTPFHVIDALKMSIGDQLDVIVMGEQLQDVPQPVQNVSDIMGPIGRYLNQLQGQVPAEHQRAFNDARMALINRVTKLIDQFDEAKRQEGRAIKRHQHFAYRTHSALMRKEAELSKQIEEKETIKTCLRDVYHRSQRFHDLVDELKGLDFFGLCRSVIDQNANITTEQTTSANRTDPMPARERLGFITTDHTPEDNELDAINNSTDMWTDPNTLFHFNVGQHAEEANSGVYEPEIMIQELDDDQTNATIKSEIEFSPQSAQNEINQVINDYRKGRNDASHNAVTQAIQEYGSVLNASQPIPPLLKQRIVSVYCEGVKIALHLQREAKEVVINQTLKTCEYLLVRNYLYTIWTLMTNRSGEAETRTFFGKNARYEFPFYCNPEFKVRVKTEIQTHYQGVVVTTPHTAPRFNGQPSRVPKTDRDRQKQIQRQKNKKGTIRPL